MRTARLWIALTRPDNLVVALSIAALTRDRFASCHLIHERSGWWQHADWREFHSLFAGVHPMAKVKPVRGLFDAGRYVRELRSRQSALAALGIEGRDTIIALGSTTNLANALASAYPGVPKVLCLPAKFYADAIRPADTPGFRATTSGWLQNHFLERMAGVGRTVHRKHRRMGGDGARLERLEKELPEVFQALVLFSNSGADRPSGGRRTRVRRAVSGPGGFRSFPADGQRRKRARSVARCRLFRHALSARAEHRSASVRRDPQRLPRLSAAALRRTAAGWSTVRTRRKRASAGCLRLRGFIPEDDLEVAELYLLKNRRRDRRPCTRWRPRCRAWRSTTG